MAAKVILNPYAGRWKAREMRSDAEAALHAAEIEYELVVTEGPGHGIELASRAVEEGFDPVISAGGDGSISEVINGIALAAGRLNPNHWPPLGVLPLGSANDLVVNLGLPLGLAEAARVIAGGRTKLLDIGKVRWDDEQDWHYFDNNSAIGLEPSISLIQQDIKRLRGVVRYLAATLIGISRNPQWEIELEWEGGSYQGPATLVTVGNNPLTGGLFYMTPHADPYDGQLTFVYGSMPTRLQILRLLPRTMKPGPGSYVEHPAIHEVHSPWLRIRTSTPSPLHADGEIQTTRGRSFEYQILPGQLPVFIP